MSHDLTHLPQTEQVCPKCLKEIGGKMSEYEEPKFSYPGMKTDAMRVKELSKENSQLHSELQEERKAVEALKIDIMHWKQAFAETSEDRDRADDELSSKDAKLGKAVEKLQLAADHIDGLIRNELEEFIAELGEEGKDGK